MSRISIVGAGVVGTNLARAFLAAGHDVRFAARDPSSEKVAAATRALGVDAVALADAADEAEFIVLAVPYDAVTGTVDALGDLSGVTVIDATNTVGQALPAGVASILDVVRDANPRAVVVKAFNTIGAEAFTSSSIDGRPLFLPIAGDPDPADAVASLASSIGFDALVIGGPETARILENFAELWIHLAFRTGLGRDFGFARVSR